MPGSWESAVQLMYSSRKCSRYTTDTPTQLPYLTHAPPTCS